jgi:hypothetical protein
MPGAKPPEPFLTLRGREREDEVERTMRARLVPLNRPGEERMTWSDLLDRLGQHPPGTDMFAREVEIERAVGEFDLSGRMDFVILRWVEGAPTLRIVECKSSRKDKTYHRIQLAAYRIMVTEALGEQGLTIGGRTYRMWPWNRWWQGSTPSPTRSRMRWPYPPWGWWRR